jgi:FkbM family methyltransferase
VTDTLYNFTSKAIKALSKHDIVSKQIDGFDKRLYYERSQHLTFLFQNKISYEINIWNNVKSFLNEGDLIFDIGGNIGQYAMRFSEAVGTKGKIISFEPDFKNFAFLQFNSNQNACKNIQCLNMGLGEKPETIEFFRDTETGGRMGSFGKEFVKDKFKGFTDLVEVETFDRMVQKYGIPNFVKIDVEGFEFNVLKGVKDFSKTTKFLVEVRESTKGDVFDIFTQHHFKCFMVDDKVSVKINSKTEIPQFANLLFTA